MDIDRRATRASSHLTQGDLSALLHELLVDHLDAVLGCPLDVTSLDRVVISSHSGGYWAAASVLAMGDVPSIREVDLLDSLYGEIPTFYSWAQTGITLWIQPVSSCTVERHLHRDRRHRRQLADDGDRHAELGFDDAGLGSSELDDLTTDTLDAGAYLHPVIFKLGSLTHDESRSTTSRSCAKSSGFATIPRRKPPCEACYLHACPRNRCP